MAQLQDQSSENVETEKVSAFGLCNTGVDNLIPSIRAKESNNLIEKQTRKGSGIQVCRQNTYWQ
jgi:hypothetical protein